MKPSYDFSTIIWWPTMWHLDDETLSHSIVPMNYERWRWGLAHLDKVNRQCRYIESMLTLSMPCCGSSPGSGS